MVELINQDYKYNVNLYKNNEQKLKNLLGNSVSINHVGSTAIPNMVGKNIIDILVGAKDKEEFNLFSNILKNNGYYPSKNSKTDIYEFFASSESETKDGDIHIHLAKIDTERYNDFLILKNYLLKNPSKALAYSKHKEDILKNKTSDRNEYRKIKSEYVISLIKKAKSL